MELHRELSEVARANGLELEVVFVDDGSSDDSWLVIRELATGDPRVHGVRLRRNFGKSAALLAGIRAGSGDTFCLLDGDGQDDPAEIPRLLAALDEGLDLANGWRRRRCDPWRKVIPSRVFNFLANRLSGTRLHDHNCGMKALRAEVFREVRLYGELHRFIPILADARGFRVGEVAVNHRPRRSGRSKYGSHRFLIGLLDLLTVKFLVAYRGRPQHLLGTFGLLSVLVGSVGMSFLAWRWLQQFWAPELYQPIATRPLAIYSVAALIFGAQMVSVALAAALVTASAARDEDCFSIAEQLGRE